MNTQNRLSALVLALSLALPAGAAFAGETCATTPAPGTPPVASGTDALACGNGSRATGARSTAVGHIAQATDESATSVGNDARATNRYASAFGAGAYATEGMSVAVGYASRATGTFSTALGGGAEATQKFATAVGNGAWAKAQSATALGTAATSTGAGSIALGGAWDIDGNGAANEPEGWTTASGFQAVAIGTAAHATADGAVAIGAFSSNDRANTVSVGSATQQRQITNVAAGTQATDAVNLSQLQSTLATAKAYTDTAVATGGTASNAYTDNREAAIRSDMTAADNQIRSEVQAGDAATLQSAKQYVDARFADVLGVDLAGFGRRLDSVEARLGAQDQRISRLGALSAAMTQMTANAMGTQNARGRLSIGAGWYGGEKAVSVGYGRKLGTRLSMTLGGAFSASERSAGVGFGVDL